MRFVTYRHDGEQHLGLLSGDETVVDLAKAPALAQALGLQIGPVPADMLGFIAAGEAALASARQLADALAAESRQAVTADLLGKGVLVRLAEVALLAPIPRPRKNVFCLGLNYADHAAEGNRVLKRDISLPEVPIFFTKAVTAVTGPGAEIPLALHATKELDYEAELGVVIGRQGKNIAAADAYDYVFGYTIVNDISARDLQRRHNQWFKGKSLDGTCPLGPHIVHKDELPNPMNLAIASRVNGEQRQHSNTSRMIFSIPQTIESLSLGMTLEPGDIIATGTPEGVGFAMQPPALLHDGDVVEIEVEGIGILRNRVRAL
ncbi:MAG: fumarylacetoacetate hydrolase family protein [Dehalococcoidales bacterium]|nr:fumarylacetoacetate hydrolase family protein [Dehalococcoidales bacterium]